jgi:hypothetical protein
MKWTEQIFDRAISADYAPAISEIPGDGRENSQWETLPGPVRICRY